MRTTNFLLLVAFVSTGNLRAQPTCEIGAYRSPTGQLAAITVPAPGSPGLRYTLLDGRRGYLSDATAPFHCLDGKLSDGVAAWEHVDLKQTRTSFRSSGVTLRGLLMEPKQKSEAPPPLLVFVHGSEKTSPIGAASQYLLSAQGVSTFYFDKRGTGESAGDYTQDFLLLADDAAAAVQEARRLATIKYSRVGLFGGSQGGWVAPLAALKSKADFVEVGFGVVGTAAEQDQWQVDYQLSQLGYDDKIKADVHAVTEITAKIAASNFHQHLDELAALRDKYAKAPWFKQIDGQYSGELLRGEVERAQSESPGVPWGYSGIETLRRLSIPQLWVLAGSDSVAPSAPTITRLQQLRSAGSNIEIVVFPNTDHGIRNFTIAADGTRKAEGVADGYFRLLADWAKGVSAPPYATAILKAPASAAHKSMR